MIEYNERDFPNLYKEILKDYHYRFPKFYNNPYPNLSSKSNEINQQNENSN